MDQVKNQSSRLFVTSTVENKDDIEEKFERSYHFVHNLTSGLSDKDAHDALNNALVKEKGHEDVSLGLLVTILTEPQSAVKSYRDLTLITRDGLGLVLTHLSQLVLDRYLRFNDIAKNQLLWLLREFIKNSVSNVDNLCWNLMRHAAGGDVSPKNINLIESLLDVFIEFKGWLERFPVLLASVVYTFLRLLEDHNAPYLTSLRQKEVAFLIGIIREKFFECLVIGRDLVRLLQNVARIPEFDVLWKDMLIAPKSLCPSFNGVLQLLQTRTSRRFLQSRLTPEMERKLVFLTSQVRFGNHKRYQEWFQRQYLSTPESQSLRCDMIRRCGSLKKIGEVAVVVFASFAKSWAQSTTFWFADMVPKDEWAKLFIVGVIHPTNELLCSDIIPRWAVIGWLLTTCTSSVAVSNAKLALFYDWLFYESDKDNIMNIEPAILVMHHSMRSHPAVSATLLDFLCRIIANFYPPLADKVKSGIFSSLRQILDKRVLPSLLPLFDNAKLDRELRVMVRDTFKEFCSITQLAESSKSEESIDGLKNRLLTNHIMNEPAFSDEEEDCLTINIHAPEDDTDDDDIPLAKVRLKKEKTDKNDEEVPAELPFKGLFARFANEKSIDKKCEVMEGLVKQICGLDVEDDFFCNLGRYLCNNVLQDEFKTVSLPPVVDEKSLNESVNSPLFVLFRALYGFFKEDSEKKQLLLRLLSEMYSFQPSLGYILLYFLKVHLLMEKKVKEETALKISVYKEFCSNLGKKLDVCLYDDLNACHLSDNKLMLWILPDLYKDFKQQTINNAQILKILVSVIDAKQLQELCFKIVQGQLTMFKSDNLQVLLKITLTWETIEQFFFWQLLQAHLGEGAAISRDAIVPLIPFLEGESLTSAMLILKNRPPSADSMKYLFSRDIVDDNADDDDFVFTLIKCWCDENTEKVGELIFNLLSTRYPSTSPNKRKRTGNKSLNTSVPSSDQVLRHLERLRVRFVDSNDLSLFRTDFVVRGLLLAHAGGGDGQRKQFHQLFTLVEEDSSSVGKSGRPAQGRGRKPGKGKRVAAKDVSDTSEESSEEEEIVKPKQAKKRKKVMSDSD